MKDRSVRDGLRDALIAGTVRHANAFSPFYRDLYAKCGCDPAGVNCVDSLRNLPVVSKRLLRESNLSACAYEERTYVSHVQHTSGTTGRPLLLYRSVDEVDFIQQFFSRVEALGPGPTHRPILLQLHRPHHGTSTPVPSPFFVLDAAITDEASVEHCFHLLLRSYDMPSIANRVGGLAGGNLDVYLLSLLAEERIGQLGVEGTPYPLGVSLAGSYVTARWRRELERIWGTAPVDRFSASEVFGGATFCQQCAGHHFDPHVVAEVVNVKTGKPLLSGLGMLALTSLFPFVQLQPMIRYATGDLFELEEEGCIGPTFRFRGRVDQALFSETTPDELLLDGATLQDVLDDELELTRTDHFPGIRHPLARIVGMPRARGLVGQKEDRPLYRLRVESQLAVDDPREKAISLVHGLRKKLLAASPDLARNVAQEACVFEVELAEPFALGQTIEVRVWSGEPGNRQ